ncbi:MAG: F0F1 ATP synthase subunit delta [Pseudomonadota bacterium]
MGVADITFTDGVADRYATALFDLARDENALEAVEKDVETLSAAFVESEDLRTVVSSPIYGREEQARAMASVNSALGLGPLVSNLVALMASKRRLFVLESALKIFRQQLAEHRGEITAEVTAARALSDAQRDHLAATLKDVTGQDVKLDIRVDESLIGGLIVKVGSKMIDTSIRSQLASLHTTMKEAG